MEIRKFYMEYYPTDEMGYDISSDATWIGFLNCINTGKDIYEYIGVYDSMVRERLFDGIANLIGVPYSEIYYKWLNTDL